MSETKGSSSFLGSLKQKEFDPSKHAKNSFWDILVVDDDPEVHEVTKLVLKNFIFEDKTVRIESAYTGAEAEVKIQDRPDTALILLDVVMEHDSAGLDFVKYVRDTLKNRKVRILLRTGHAGQAPEDEVIVKYDINDYKDKTELTSLKLRTAVIAALRSFRDISIIDAHRLSLQKIIDSLAGVFKMQTLKRLASAVLSQLSTLLGFNTDSICIRSGMTISRDASNSFSVIAASGEFEKYLDIEDCKKLPPDIATSIETAFTEKRTVKNADSLVAYTRSQSGSENVICLTGMQELTDWELRLVDIFSMNASIAFDNQYLHDELEDTQKEIIITLGEIAEKRSRETGRHVKRVTEYSQFLGKYYGLNENDLLLLGSAVPTHDIGKLAIPDGILNKPGKLTDEEMNLMRTHAEVGYLMLCNSHRPILRASAIIAKSHHEYWDGSGYPDGLAGEAIPVFGRIVALADVFDALGHDRVYKKAWPIEEIIAYVQKQKGVQFEPRLVDIFFENLAELTAIQSSFPD